MSQTSKQSLTQGLSCGIARPLSFRETVNFLKVSSYSVIINFKLEIIHQNGITELEMLFA